MYILNIQGMKAMNLPSQNTPINGKTQIILSVEVKDLSQIITTLFQTGVYFKLNYSCSLDNNEQTRVTAPLPSANGSIVERRPNIQEFFWDRLDRLINEYLENGVIPTIEVIAEKIGIKSNSMNAKIQNKYGKTFYQYYLERKMNYAAELLKMGYTAQKVSDAIGYTHPIKFSKMFQKHFQITPKKFQQNFAEKNLGIR